jgi:hypothetical protein
MSWRALIGKLAIALSILPAALMPATAGAEVLDELVVLTEHADAVIRISFGLRIQYLRHEIFGDGFVEIYFRPLTLEPAGVTESRRIAPGPSFPGVEVVYPVQAGAQTRKVNVRLTGPLKNLRVRPTGDRAIDLVIPGGAALIARPLAPTVPAAPEAAPVPAPIPAPAAPPPVPAVPVVPPAPEPLAQFRLIRLASFSSVAAMHVPYYPAVCELHADDLGGAPAETHGVRPCPRLLPDRAGGPGGAAAPAAPVPAGRGH